MEKYLKLLKINNDNFESLESLSDDLASRLVDIKDLVPKDDYEMLMSRIYEICMIHKRELQESSNLLEVNKIISSK